MEMVWCGARNGGSVRSGAPGAMRPATEWMVLTSNASSAESGGRRSGSRLASIVFPAPGGPIRSRLWHPAAAISRARRATACPRTSARSPPVPGRGRSESAPFFHTAPPERDRGAPSDALRARSGSGSAGSSPRSSRREPRGRQAMPGTALASAVFSRGSHTGPSPARRAAASTTRMPRVARSVPSRASSPTKRPSATCGGAGICPDARRSATAIGRSNRAPSFRTWAGARLIVILRAGNSKPQLRTAASTRSRLSRTAASGSPTIVNVGRPTPRSASTSTSRPSIPTVAQLSTRASRSFAPRGRGRVPGMGRKRAGAGAPAGRGGCGPEQAECRLPPGACQRGGREAGWRKRSES